MAKKNAAAKKKTGAEMKVLAEKKVVPEKKAVLDRDFVDLLKAANTPEEAGKRASTLDPGVIGLFETALTTLKDAKHRFAEGKDITKEILNGIEYLQFGISKLKAANK
jgi:hypothetical protein